MRPLLIDGARKIPFALRKFVLVSAFGRALDDAQDREWTREPAGGDNDGGPGRATYAGGGDFAPQRQDTVL